jgi:hypothetical protein
LWYVFDPAVDDFGPGGIHDRSGNGHDGTVIDYTLAEFVLGPTGNQDAIYLRKDDGMPGSGIDTGTDTTTVGIDTGPFTVMAWANRDDPSGFDMVFGTANVWVSLDIGFRLGDVYFGWSLDYTSVSGLVPAGEWHHVAWRYDPSSGNKDTIVDGQLVCSFGGHAPYGETQELLVGRTAPGYYGAFGGSLSDVRVYGVALSDDDIATIAANPP